MISWLALSKGIAGVPSIMPCAKNKPYLVTFSQNQFSSYRADRNGYVNKKERAKSDSSKKAHFATTFPMSHLSADGQISRSVCLTGTSNLMQHKFSCVLNPAAVAGSQYCDNSVYFRTTHTGVLRNSRAM